MEPEPVEAAAGADDEAEKKRLKNQRKKQKAKAKKLAEKEGGGAAAADPEAADATAGGGGEGGEAGTPEEEAAAAKKREANRKKRERKKKAGGNKLGAAWVETRLAALKAERAELDADKEPNAVYPYKEWLETSNGWSGPLRPHYVAPQRKVTNPDIAKPDYAEDPDGTPFGEAAATGEGIKQVSRRCL